MLVHHHHANPDDILCLGAGGAVEAEAGLTGSTAKQAGVYKRLNGQAFPETGEKKQVAAHCWRGGEISPKKLEIGEKLNKVQGDDCDEEVKRHGRW